MIIFPRVFSALIKTLNDNLVATGKFGSETVLNRPEEYSASPLVQIATNIVGSQITTDEAIAYLFNQNDPNIASGSMLKKAYASQFGISTDGKTDEQIRAQYFQLRDSNQSVGSIESVMLQRDDVDSARFIRIDGDSGMIAIRGVFDEQSVAEDIYTKTDIGLFKLVGDTSIVLEDAGCLEIKVQKACPLFVALNLTYDQAECKTFDEDARAIEIAKTLDDVFYNIGQHPSDILKRLAGLDIHYYDVKLARRPRELRLEDPDDGVEVTIDGENVIWASDTICERCSPQPWEVPSKDCINIEPWEYVLFDPQFITFTRVEKC